jgi:hypothetical protein
MAVALPITGLAVDFNIPRFFSGFFEMNDSAFEVRPCLAIPFPEVKDFESLAIRRVPFRAVFPIEESGLDFDFALSHGSFLQMICLPS